MLTTHTHSMWTGSFCRLTAGYMRSKQRLILTAWTAAESQTEQTFLQTCLCADRHEELLRLKSESRWMSRKDSLLLFSRLSNAFLPISFYSFIHPLSGSVSGTPGSMLVKQCKRKRAGKKIGDLLLNSDTWIIPELTSNHMSACLIPSSAKTWQRLAFLSWGLWRRRKKEGGRERNKNKFRYQTPGMEGKRRSGAGN